MRRTTTKKYNSGHITVPSADQFIKSQYRSLDLSRKYRGDPEIQREYYDLHAPKPDDIGMQVHHRARALERKAVDSQLMKFQKHDKHRHRYGFMQKRSKYSIGASLQLYAPKAVPHILRYYLRYGSSRTARLLNLSSPSVVTYIARSHGVCRTRAEAIAFRKQLKPRRGVIRPTPAQIRAINAKFFRERAGYYRLLRVPSVKPEAAVDIPEYENRYAVMPDGRVWSYPHHGSNRGKFIKLYFRERSGRRAGSFTLCAILCANYKYRAFSVKRLVAQAFIPNPERKRYVHTKNGVSDDCRSSNLEWMTASELLIASWVTRRRERSILEARGWASAGRNKPFKVPRVYDGFRWKPDKKLAAEWKRDKNLKWHTHPWHKAETSRINQIKARNPRTPVPT